MPCHTNLILSLDKTATYELPPEYINQWSRLITPQKNAMEQVELFIRQSLLELVDRRKVRCDDLGDTRVLPTRWKDSERTSQKMAQRDIPLSDLCARMTDIAGVRIICYYLDEIPEIVRAIKAIHEFEVPDADIEDYTENRKSDGYRSLHAIVWRDITIEGQPLRMPCEVQVRTTLQHAWASKAWEKLYEPERKGLAVDARTKAQMEVLSDLLHAADKMLAIVLK